MAQNSSGHMETLARADELEQSDGFAIPAWAVISFFAFLAALVLIAPRASVATFFITAAISALYLWRVKEPVIAPSSNGLVLWVFLLFTTYCAINASWAVDVAEGYTKVGLLIAVLVGTYLTTRVIQIAPRHEIDTLTKGLSIGVILAGLFLLFEFFTDRSIQLYFYNLLPFIRSDSAKHLTIVNDRVISIATPGPNRSVAFLVFCLWPVLLVLSNRLKEFKFYLAAGTILVAMFAIVFMSVHESSKLALCASLIVFALALASTKIATLATAIGWIAAFSLIIPFAFYAHNANWHTASWLQPTAQARIIIWYETATRTLETPVSGIGVRSIKALDRKVQAGKMLETKKGEVYPRHIGRHTHNFFLQTWYELGLIGVFLLAAFGLTIMRWIATRGQTAQPYLLATFASVTSIAAFSWGMWQGWYLYGIALTFLFTILADRLSVRLPEADGVSQTQ